MAKYVETLSTHGSDKEAADAASVKLAKLLTRQGRGRSHYVTVKKFRGVWRVDLYER